MYNYPTTGIRNALMMTPTGQQAIQRYQFGGQTTTGGGLSDASIEDILAGRARFYNPLSYRDAKEEEISETLVGTSAEDPYLRRKKIIPPEDRGGDGEGQLQGYAQWGADYKDPFVDRRTGLTKEEFEMAGGGWTDPTETIGGLGGLGSTLANIGSAAINFFPGIGWLPKAGATLSNAFLNPDSLAQKGLRSLGIIDEEPTEISAPVIAAIPEAEAIVSELTPSPKQTYPYGPLWGEGIGKRTEVFPQPRPWFGKMTEQEFEDLSYEEQDRLWDEHQPLLKRSQEDYILRHIPTMDVEDRGSGELTSIPITPSGDSGLAGLTAIEHETLDYGGGDGGDYDSGDFFGDPGDVADFGHGIF